MFKEEEEEMFKEYSKRGRVGEEEKAKVRMGNNLYLQDIQFFNGGK